MLDWWNTLSLASQIFYCIAVPATLLLLIQTVLLFLGIGDDADGTADGTGDMHDDIPDAPDVDAAEADAVGMGELKLFTLRGIVAFFVTFGWLGVVMEGAGVDLWITLSVSFVCGVGMMLLLALLFRWMMKLRSDGTLDNRNAIGTSGKVYLTVPPSRSGEGKVQLMLQGVYAECNAVTDEETAIPTGAEIVVIGISGQTDLVVKRK